MPEINRRKFLDCLVKYKRVCLNIGWRRQQLHKFYFSNYLASRVKLGVQSVSSIFEICSRIQTKNYYFSDSATKVTGIQFLKGTGNPQFTELLTVEDVQLFKKLAQQDGYEEEDFAGANLSFHALSGWLGTLLPHMFVPVTSVHFRHSISHLFDKTLLIYEEPAWDYFIQSQECLHITKEYLKEFEMRALYLTEINDYMRMHYPKFSGKTEYNEADWNWVTQDFHLFIFREMLHMDALRMFEAEVNPELAASGIDLLEGMKVTTR